MTAPLPQTDSDRLDRQFAFLAEADRLKSVLRASTLCDASRRENSAEHSWHLALYAMTLADQAGASVRIDRVIGMLVLHDLVEIDVGDVPIHSGNGEAHGSQEIREAEARAAERIFGLLPRDQAEAFRLLWDEFEAGETSDALFARSLDRVQPVMANVHSGGGTWKTFDVTWDQLQSRVGSKIERGAPGLWAWVKLRARGFFSD